MATKYPELRDEVKHKRQDAVGTVFAKYVEKSVTYLDVRVGDDIVYHTPAANWETVRTEEEMW